MKTRMDILNEKLEKWKRKLAYFENQEVAVSDFTIKFNLEEEKTKAKEKISEIEQQIKAEREKVKDFISMDSSSLESLHQALNIFGREVSNLNNNSTTKEIEQIEQLKQQLLEELLGGYELKISSSPILKDRFVTSLFESIITSEKLNDDLLKKITKVRKDIKNYEFQHRSVIVSSLTISLLSWKKFDPQKLHLLIDFATDFEKYVWEKSLTGLVLNCIIHQNRLARFGMINRLTQLQNNQNIQIGIYLIDVILRRQLYKNVALPEIMKNSEFLEESPHNWFVPFYSKNEVLIDALDASGPDFDEEEFVEFIESVPYVNALKYAICDGFRNRKIKISKVKNDNMNKRKEDIIDSNLLEAHMMQPYYNNISEIYLYYKVFPKERLENLFSRKVTLANTKLKNIILGKVQLLALNADLHFENKEYNFAIKYLKELLNIEPNSINGLSRIADCYYFTNRFSDCLTYLLQLEKITPYDLDNIQNIGVCYHHLEQYKNALIYLNKVHEEHPDNIKVLALIADIYYHIEQYNDSIKRSLEVLSIDPEHEGTLINLTACYERLDNYKDSLVFSKKLISVNPEDPKHLIKHAHNLAMLNEFEEANELGSKAYFIGRGEIQVEFLYGRILFLTNKLENAEIVFKNVLKYKEPNAYHGVTYGNLGHIHLFNKNKDKSLEYYKKCVMFFDDIHDFKSKFDFDLPYALKNNVSELEYFDIRDSLINYWRENK